MCQSVDKHLILIPADDVGSMIPQIISLLQKTGALSIDWGTTVLPFSSIQYCEWKNSKELFLHPATVTIPVL